MPRRVAEAEGVTFELGDYISTGIGSLSNRLLDVEKLLWGKVTTDTTLDSFPDSGKIDPQLWDVAISSLEWGVEGATHSRNEKAGHLVREVRERKRKFKLREKQQRCRAGKKQVCGYVFQCVFQARALFLPHPSCGACMANFIAKTRFLSCV